MSHGCELVGRLTVPKQLDRARAARSGPGTAGWRGAGFVHPHGAHAEGCRRNVLRCDDSHGVVGAEKNDVQLAVSNNRGKTLRYNFQCLYTSGHGRDSSTLLNGTVNGTVNTSTIDSAGISTGGPPSNETNSTKT